MEATGDQQHRLFFYDGKTFTLFAPRLNFYATVPAPPTIVELIDKLKEKFDIELPLVDMFYWGTPRAAVDEIKSAIDLGPTSIGGVSCEQFAFRQPGIDWQIWIQNGDYPLPRKLVISTLTDEARPQYTSVYTWNLAPSFDEAASCSMCRKTRYKITFADVQVARCRRETERRNTNEPIYVSSGRARAVLHRRSSRSARTHGRASTGVRRR